jgi:hypothetical protein
VIVLVVLSIGALLVGLGTAFLYPWDMERVPEPRRFAGSGVNEKPIERKTVVYERDTDRS